MSVERSGCPCLSLGVWLARCLSRRLAACLDSSCMVSQTATGCLVFSGTAVRLVVLTMGGQTGWRKGHQTHSQTSKESIQNGGEKHRYTSKDNRQAWKQTRRTNRQTSKQITRQRKTDDERTCQLDDNQRQTNRHRQTDTDKHAGKKARI